MPSDLEISDYLKRSGDDEFHSRLPLVEFNEGWFNYSISTGITGTCRDFVIFQAYGNHRAIARYARQLAKAYDCERILFGTSRNGDALARLCGGEVIGVMIELPMEGS